MSQSFRLQDPGEGIHEARIIEVFAAEGDSISEGDTLFEIETDKAAVDVPAPFTGRIEEMCVKEGETVSVGDVLVTWTSTDEDEDEDGDKADSPEEQKKSEDDDDEREDDRDDSKTGHGEDDEDADADTDADADASKGSVVQDGPDEHEQEPDKQARKSKAEQDDTDENADASDDDSKESVAQDGPDEHEQKPDKQAREAKAEQDDTDENGAKREEDSGSTHVAAAPATRKLAEELGVDIESVSGSGPDGRVEPDDVRDAAESSGDRKGEESSTDSALPDFSQWGETDSRPLESIRRTISKRMLESWQKIPHVMHGDRFDITRLEELRKDQSNTVEAAGGKLTITAFALKAVAAALKEFPRFNASLDTATDTLIVKRYCHVGVAVDTDAGLLVPVIRNVDGKSITELSVELAALAERARSGDLKPGEMQGGSITLTNPGAIGGSMFTPIIRHPEVAIIGLGAARPEPAAIEKEGELTIVNRILLPLTVSFDHRVNDGADAARFAARIGALLESPQELLLEA